MNVEFGPYELVREIGRGGMGIVFLAYHRITGENVALKKLLPGSDASEQSRRRFLREARTSVRLSHPNIVRVRDVGEHNGVLYFTMDIIDGVSLRQLVRGFARDTAGERLADEPCSARAPSLGTRGRRKAWQTFDLRATGSRMEATVAMTLMRKVALAIQHAHDCGVLHRDLKPENIMIDCAGEPIVLDFGLARLAGEPNLTKTGQMIGTFSYMAPEQLTEQGAGADARTDIYAAGLILYELVTGVPVIPPSTEPAQSIWRILNLDPPPPRRLVPSLPADIESIVLKAIDRDPARRYDTARAFADDIERYLTGEPVKARSAGWSFRLWRRAVKHRWRVFLVGSACALLVVTLGMWVNQRQLRWAGWNLAFEDRFDTALLGSEWVASGGEWEVVNGELIGAASTNAYLVLDQPVPGDIRMEVRARCLRTGRPSFYEAAMFCNVSMDSLDNSGYFVSIGSDDGVKLQRKGFNVAVTRKLRAEPEGIYIITLERVGPQVTVTVNGSRVVAYQDPMPVSSQSQQNRVGLYLYDSSTAYDDFRVWQRGAALVVSVLEKGNVLFDRGNFSAAVEEYRLIQQSRPGADEAWEAGVREGLCYLALAKAVPGGGNETRLAQAEQRLREVQRQGPSPFREHAQAALAEIELERGKPGVALNVALQDIEDNPILRSAIRPVITRGQSIANPGDLDVVARFAEAAASLYPEDARLVTGAWMTEGLLRRRLGDLETARMLFVRVRTSYPESSSYASWATWELARTLAIGGDLKDAREILHELPAVYPENEEYCSAALAEEAVHQMLARRPAVASRLLRLLRKRYPQQTFAVWLKLIVDGTQPRPDDKTVRTGEQELLCGLQHLVDGKASEARECLEKSLELTDEGDDSSFPRWEAEALLHTLN